MLLLLPTWQQQVLRLSSSLLVVVVLSLLLVVVMLLLSVFTGSGTDTTASNWHPVVSVPESVSTDGSSSSAAVLTRRQVDNGDLSDQPVPKSPGSPQQREHLYSVQEVLETAVFFAPFWCGANIAFNCSLSLTSVASGTILSSTSSMWVFLFGLVFLNQVCLPVYPPSWYTR